MKEQKTLHWESQINTLIQKKKTPWIIDCYNNSTSQPNIELNLKFQ